MTIPNISGSGGAASGGTAANSGVTTSPWYQGDFVTSWAGDAYTGPRTAPAGGSLTGALGIGGTELLIAVAIIGGALLWRKFR